MSFSRLTFYCAMIGGWAAFFGWLFGEALWMHRAAVPADWMIVATAALCGMFIGGGLNFLAGIAMGQGWWAVPRLVVGMAVGLASGDCRKVDRSPCGAMLLESEVWCDGVSEFSGGELEHRKAARTLPGLFSNSPTIQTGPAGLDRSNSRLPPYKLAIDPAVDFVARQASRGLRMRSDCRSWIVVASRTGFRRCVPGRPQWYRSKESP